MLSAGHCFCTKTPCKDDGSGNLLVDFVPKERVACIVGLNDIALLPRFTNQSTFLITIHQVRKRYKKTAAYFAEEIIIHPHYHPKKHQQDDMVNWPIFYRGSYKLLITSFIP